MSDDIFANFIAITGADEDTATHYLSAADFDLGTAVTLFNESQPQQRQPARPAPQVQRPPSLSPSTGDDPYDQPAISQQRVTRLVDMDHDAPGPGPGPGPGPRLTMAQLFGAIGEAQPRRPANAGRGSGAGAGLGSALDVFGPPGLMGLPRAPGPNFQGGSRRQAHPRFHDDGEMYDEDYDDDGYGFADSYGRRGPSSSSSAPRPASALDHMFKPPSFAYTGNFRDVCNVGRRDRKWVILNVLVRESFESSRINRDLWGNDLVEAIIAGFALVYQCVSDTPEGAEAIRTYNLRRDQLPCMFIVNPVTRSVVREIPLRSVSFSDEAKGLDPEKFINIITAFAEKNELPDPTTLAEFNPTPTSGAAVGDDDEDIDDAILQAALKMSAQEQQQQQQVDEQRPFEVVDDDGDDNDVGGDPQPVPRVAAASVSPPPELPPPELKREPAVAVDIAPHQCAATEPDAFRMRLKLPEGPHDEVLRKSTPGKLFLLYVVQLLRAQGQSAASIETLELLAGFPPKRMPLDRLLEEGATLGDLGVRSGETFTPHVTG